MAVAKISEATQSIVEILLVFVRSRENAYSIGGHTSTRRATWIQM
jgi:hypothetical protein